MTYQQWHEWAKANDEETKTAVTGLFRMIERSFPEQPDLNDDSTYYEIYHAAILAYENQLN